jgi:hypothetical protein
MASYTISGCTVADGPAIARNNVPAFWEDPHWRLPWRHRTLEQHVACVAKRTPRLLIEKPTTKRHQKAIDPGTGHVLGYSRWNIPASHSTNSDGTLAWREAVVPAVSPEEEAEILRIASAEPWDPNGDMDDLDLELRKIKKEILDRKSYMRMYVLVLSMLNVNNLQVWTIWLCIRSIKARELLLR